MKGRMAHIIDSGRLVLHINKNIRSTICLIDFEFFITKEIIIAIINTINIVTVLRNHTKVSNII